MLFEGVIRNGVVVFDAGQSLPDGTLVDVTVRVVSAPKPTAPQPTLRDRLQKLAGTVDDLPTDMARNHDHYIHGAPPR